MTVQDADDGDTTTSIETLIDAAEQIEAVRPDGDGTRRDRRRQGLSQQSVARGPRSRRRAQLHLASPIAGDANWTKNPRRATPVYRNRRRIRGARGRRLLRLARRAVGTPVRASLRDRRDASRASPRSHEHSEAAADSCRRLQSRAPHAAADRRRHAARPAGPAHRGRGRPSGAHSRALGAL